MKIEREALLVELESVRAGLAPRENIEQSACFIFRNGKVITFNDEVSCRRTSLLKGVEGAVVAKALTDVLHKIQDTHLDVEQIQNELCFGGHGKKFSIALDPNITLPVDRVEPPNDWRKLPKEIIEAVGMVQHCVGKDESKFVTTCVHLFADGIEACDNRQMIRCRIKTGFESSIIVRGTSIANICNMAIEQVSLADSWIHFKSSQGVTISCRRYEEEFPDLEPVLAFKGTPTSIPKDLAKACDRAAIFAEGEDGSDPVVSVSMIPGKLKIVGEGHIGWYKEIKDVVYSGPPLDFLIAPELLRQIGELYKEAEVGEERLKVTGGNWIYISALRPKRKESN